MPYTFATDNEATLKASGRRYTFKAAPATPPNLFAGADRSGAAALPAAKTGTLTTRTDNTTGTLTMAGGHGIMTGARLDIYWAGGRRYGVTVGTVATNSVPFSLGAGDNLPVATTPITAMVPVLEAVTVVGANVVAFGVDADFTATAVFCKSDDTIIKAVKLDGVSAYFWRDDSLDLTPLAPPNPLTGNTVAKIYLSHADAAKAEGVWAELLYN